MHPIPRRRFIRDTAAGAAALAMFPTGASCAETKPIRLAVIGHMYVADHFFTSIHAYENVQLVAVCHPDQRKLPEIYKKWEDAAAKLGGSANEKEKRGA